jgi:hypothetical protein
MLNRFDGIDLFLQVVESGSFAGQRSGCTCRVLP